MNMAATQLQTLPFSTVSTEYLTSKQIQPGVNHKKKNIHIILSFTLMSSLLTACSKSEDSL